MTYQSRRPPLADYSRDSRGGLDLGVERDALARRVELVRGGRELGFTRPAQLDRSPQRLRAMPERMAAAREA